MEHIQNEYNMKSTISILIGPRLGDFLYSLCIPSYIYETLNKKSNIFICEGKEKFRQGLKKTYNDLKKIMYNQPYVNQFNIYKNEKIDIDMTSWRRGKLNEIDWKNAKKNKLTWNEFYFKIYFNNIPPTKEIINIPIFKKISKYKNWLIINRAKYIPKPSRVPPALFYTEYFNTPQEHDNSLRNKYPQEKLRGKSIRDLYLEYINQYKNVGFIFYDEQQYEEFPLKNKVKPIKAKNLEHMINIIGSCDKFIGSQSAPLAIAHSLNVKRVVEANTPTAWRYVINEKKFFKNVEVIY